MGYKTIGVEPGGTARELAIKKGLEVVPDESWLDEGAGESPGAITLWHVLEHMHLPVSALQRYRRLLPGDGLLLVAVPMSGSFDARFYGSRWAAYDVPRHLFHFDQHDLIDTLAGQGFVLEARHGLFFDSFYVCLLTEQQEGRLWRPLGVLRALWVATLSNLLAMLRIRPWSSQVFLFRKSFPGRQHPSATC